MNAKHLAIFALASLALVACKKEDPVTPDPAGPSAPATTGTLRLSVEFMNGMAPFDLDAAHTDGAGNNIRFTSLKFYVSGAKAMDAAGALAGSFNSTYMLVDAATPLLNNFTLGSMTAGHVHELHFLLGLDEATNRIDPLLADYPLNIPGMHWSWNPSAGYKFMSMEGYLDVNNNGVLDDGTDVLFEYHCAQNVSQAATAPVLRESQLMVHQDLAVGATVTVVSHVNMATMLTGVDLLATPVAMGNGAGNQLLMDNLAASISSH